MDPIIVKIGDVMNTEMLTMGRMLNNSSNNVRDVSLEASHSNQIWLRPLLVFARHCALVAVTWVCFIGKLTDVDLFKSAIRQNVFYRPPPEASSVACCKVDEESIHRAPKNDVGLT